MDRAEPGVAHPVSRPPWLVVVAFVLLGAFWGSWNASLASVQRSFGLSNTALGLLLAGGVVAGALAGAFAGHRAESAGPLAILAGLFAAWALVCAPLLWLDGLWSFALAFTAVQVVMGAVDAVMNVGATAALEGSPGSLVRFHATFNLGAMAGAMATGWFGLGANGGSRLWPAIAVALSVSVAWAWIRRRPGAVDPRPSDHVALPSPVGDVVVVATSSDAPSPFRVLVHDHLVGLLVVFAAAALVEGGVFTWGVLYLRHYLHVGLLAGASAYALGNAITGLVRFTAGPAIDRTLPLRTLAIGASVTGATLLVEAHTHTAWLALAMLVVAAAGVSLNWPLLMADVARRSSAPGSAVGAFTAAGYFGWVAGAPLVGIVADQAGLPGAISTIAVLGVVVGLSAAGLALQGQRSPDRPVT